MRISDWTSDVCSSDLLYARLTPWQRTQVARHPERPHFKDYAAALIADFTPLAGDRNFGEDAAITGGLGRFRGRPVVVLGHEKGKIGRASCRERVCQDVKISGVAVTLKKNQNTKE